MDDLPVGRGNLSEIRREAKRFKVITNGLRTESGYFLLLDKMSFDVIEVETKKGFSLDEMLRKAKAFKECGAEYDEVCIILDMDEQVKSKRGRHNLRKFLEEAEVEGIPVYLSNESFEVWLIAHVMTVPKCAGGRGEATRLALKNRLLNNVRRKEIVDVAFSVDKVRHALVEVKRLRKTYGDDVLRAKPMTDVDLFVRKVTLLK